MVIERVDWSLSLSVNPDRGAPAFGGSFRAAPFGRLLSAAPFGRLFPFAQVEAVDSTLLQARGGQAEEAAVAARLYMYSADDLAWVNCPRRWISLVCYNVLSIDETRVRLHKTAATYFRARALQVNRHALAQRCAVRAFTVCYKTVKNKRDVGT